MIRPLKLAYLESGYKSNAADRRRLHPLVAQAPEFDVEMFPYQAGGKADVVLVRGRTHPRETYLELMRSSLGSKVVFDESNDLAPIFQVGAAWRILRGMPHWLRGKPHPGDLLARFTRSCDLVVQGSRAQNDSVRAWVPNLAAIVDALPAAEFDGSRRIHADTAVPVFLWDGASASFPQLEAIEPALAKAAGEARFRLLVFTDRYLKRPRRAPLDVAERVARFRCQTEFREWRFDQLRPTMLEADAALAVVDLQTRFNRVKPANKMISYWAYGLPVIASRTEAYQEVANDGEDARLVDQAGWAEAIVELARDARRREEMGALGYKKAWSNFSERHYASRYFQILRELP